MKTLSTEVPQKASTVQPPIRVCMHVWTSARVDVRVMREATGLVKDGFAVTIVDVEGETNQPVDENISGVCVKHVIMPSSFTTMRFTQSGLFKAAQIVFCGMLRLIQTSADIYHAHDMSALPACFIAALLRRKPFVFDAHELPLSELDRKNMRWYWIRPLLRLLLLSIVPHCAEVITVSSPIAKKFRETYHAREVSLVRNVPIYRDIPKTDCLRQYLGLEPNVRIALYQGGIQQNRSLDILVHAARFLDPGILMVFMGPNKGSTQSELEALIASEGVSDRVKILPALPYEELLEWTASADIGLCVFSLDYSLSVRWSLPNKLFEYMMVGLPVLAAQLDAVVEVINTYDIGRVAPSLDPAKLGAAINAMLADPDALARMRRNALNAVQEEYCWEKESQQLVQLYHKIMAMQNGGGSSRPTHSQTSKESFTEPCQELRGSR